MANGITGLPFPQFGGQQSPGITPVQLQPMAPNFPRPRALNRRAPEPTTKEKLAGFAPLLLEGLGSLFKGEDPPLLSREEYLESIGADPKNPDQFETARAEAYDLYGPPEEDTGTGWGSLLANMAAASMMDRGAGDYTDTYFALRKAKKDQAALKEASRATYVKERTAANPTLRNYANTDDARLGIETVRKGYNDPDDPTKTMVHTEDGWVVAGPEWVLAPAIGEAAKTATQVLSNPNYVDLVKINGELQAKEIALANTVNIGTDTIDILQQGIDKPGMASGTLVAASANFANDINANYKQLTAAFKDANNVDFIDENTGTRAQALRDALDTGTFNPETGDWDGDVNQLDAALAAFEKDTNFNLMDKIGKVAYNNVALRANFLQLAYMAAATSGQTGRTLSDKDLAFFLQIVGFGASQDPATQKDNLLRFMHSSIRNFDTEVQLNLRKDQMSRYNMEAPEFQSIIQAYWDWGDSPMNYQGYEYIPFLKRNRGIGNIDKFQTLKGNNFQVPDSSSVQDPTTPIDTGSIVSDRIKDIEDLY